jgi:hypothetical protein
VSLASGSCACLQMVPLGRGMTCSLQYSARGRTSPANSAENVHCSTKPAAKSAAADEADTLAASGRNTGSKLRCLARRAYSPDVTF